MVPPLMPVMVAIFWVQEVMAVCPSSDLIIRERPTDTNTTPIIISANCTASPRIRFVILFSFFNIHRSALRKTAA